jgi:hypothetical protein
VLALCLLASCATPSAARAGADVEVFGGLAGFWPRMDGRYDASYTPSRVGGINQLFEEPDPRSSATQSLSLQGQGGLGFGLGLNIYPHRVLGVQLLLDRGGGDLTGANPPHVVELTYDTINFPSSDRVTRTLAYSFDVPDTAGQLEQLSVSLNATARWTAGPVVSGSVSGGLSYFRVRATDLEVGGFAAWLGGHAVVFSELYRMALATDTASTVGFNVGGDVSFALGGTLALFADVRYFHGPKIDAAVQLDSFVSDNVVEVPLAQVEQFLTLPPLQLDPSSLRLLAGLKLRF